MTCATGRNGCRSCTTCGTLATVAGTGLGVAFFAVAIIIIGATIRTAVLARSREIWIMRLVGATDWFVRAPFLIEGFIKGVSAERWLCG
jgi:cell division transport system permease protein